MKLFQKFSVVFLSALILGLPCAQASDKGYSSDTILLSDFSFKVMSYFESTGLQVPQDFNKDQFFEVLFKIYPDKAKVSRIQDRYSISVRKIAQGYSIMLCDPDNGFKVMEDLSCRKSKVEVMSWKEATTSSCRFEENWNRFCP